MMKKYLQAAPAIGILSVFWVCTVFAGNNLLTNGGFEEGDLGQLGSVSIPGWHSWGDAGWHHNDAGRVIGSKGMKFWWDSCGLWQDYAAIPSATYLYSVQVMDCSADTSAINWNLQLEAEFYDAGHSAIVKTVLAVFDSSIEPDDTWVRISGAITAPAETAYGRVVLRLGNWRSGIGGAIYFDEVSVTLSNHADYNNDFYVNYEDYQFLSSRWQQAAPQYDLNSDSRIDIHDLALFAQDWMEWVEPAGAESIAVNPAVTYQEIDGFGASLTDSSAWLIHEFLTASERQAVLTDLFDPEEGIGLCYLRQPMGSSDFRLKDYSYDDLPAGVTSDYSLAYFSIAYDESYIIPTLQEILSINPNVKIMGSPWSPPVWMKTSGHIGGGRLKDDVYSTYVNYFVRFVQAYEAHGIPIDAVTLQNEPYYEPWSYPGCRMEPADQIKLVKVMGPAFQQNQIAAKILIWDHNWDNPNYPLTVLSDATARSYITGTAFHHYGGDVSAQSAVHDAYPDKAIYFTEGSDGTWNDGGFEADLIRNGTFVVQTLRNWARTIIKWNLALDENNGPKIAGGCDTCYGVITINRSTRQVSPRPQYYALGHAAKFLRPGAVRIASGSGQVQTAAFRNTDGSVVLYAVNPNAFPIPLKLEWNGQWTVGMIAGRSIMTFCWENTPDAPVKVFLTTGDQRSLLERQRNFRFHD
ncbi:MAG TPA: glycoside hydrolase family 30 beta sandwich domain-containing protein [Anaerohalosphaeraceae bacterium]|mgnify:CR=1 FL=1|nr:glycoside hydrolase family 30 beta sandwich domain-containing protein [Anaerohalosphaeraceae bacterium]